ncbi:MAG: hypothetical protein LBD52_03820 [Prevotellaceae bacterium]|jgi:uncharacterized protein (TIGR02145 family)|nr:hypothetical protein [Prevotellaceae bacterium]
MKTTMSKQFLFLAAFGCITAPVAAQTVDVTLQCGQSYTINSTVAATAATGLTYRWLENGSTVTGTATSYTVPATKSVGIYTYIRQAKTTGCTDWQNSNAFTVEVKNKEGIDGVCLGGLMWAKYNVDEPGTFAATPEALGKFYQFNRKIAYPATGTCTWTIIEIDENSDWLVDNNPCPEGWRMPSIQDVTNLRLNTINAGPTAAHGTYRVCSSALRAIPFPLDPSSCFSSLPFSYRTGSDTFAWGNRVHNWTTTQYSNTVGLALLLDGRVTHFTWDKSSAMPIRCVHD